VKSTAAPSADETPTVDEAAQLVAALQSELVGVKAALGAKVTSLEETIANLAHENLLLKRRLFGNKTERSHTNEMQLALGDPLARRRACRRSWTRPSRRRRRPREAALRGLAPSANGRSRRAGETCSRASSRASRWRARS
jgi:hypothetical protein